MYLSHNVWGDEAKDILTILKDGFLKPGVKTGRSVMHGDTKSKYIYLSINEKNDTFHLDPKLLLENVAYLNTRWNATPRDNAIKVIGSKLTPSQLTKVLKEFMRIVKKVGKKHMSHEILVTEDIDLHRYLRKVNTDDEMVEDYVRKNYKGVVVA